jgi:hypothetical protein
MIQETNQPPKKRLEAYQAGNVEQARRDLVRLMIE